MPRKYVRKPKRVTRRAGKFTPPTFVRAPARLGTLSGSDLVKLKPRILYDEDDAAIPEVVPVGNAGFIEVDYQDAPGSVHGLSDGVPGQVVYLVARSNLPLTIKHQSSSATAGTQIICPGQVDRVLDGIHDGALLVYDPTQALWQLVDIYPFDDTEGNPASAGAAAADGTSRHAARRDHVHDVTWANGYTVYDARYSLTSHAHAATYAPIGSAFVTIGSDATLTGERALVGTSNQITVTDGGANGNVTLSTPQNIHTSATPQFARLGIGIAAQSTTSLYTFVSVADTSWNGNIVNATLYNTSTSAANALKAMYFQAYFNGNATYVGDNTSPSGAIAIQGTAGIGTTTYGNNLTGALIQDLFLNNGGAGTITNGFAISIRNPVVSGGGAITNAVAIAIAKHTTATNQTHVLSGTTSIPSGNWGIYEASSYSNYFSGNVGVNTATFGASATAELAMKNGTAPTGNVTDVFQMYSADITAGNAAPHFRTENGDIIKVYKGATFTQTYSTANATLNADGVTDPAAYGAGANGYSTGAMASAVHAAVIALHADLLDVKQFINSLVDELQAMGVIG